jgi:hypothetical protein
VLHMSCKEEGINRTSTAAAFATPIPPLSVEGHGVGPLCRQRCLYRNRAFGCRGYHRSSPVGARPEPSDKHNERRRCRR